MGPLDSHPPSTGDAGNFVTTLVVEKLKIDLTKIAHFRMPRAKEECAQRPVTFRVL